jgi:hypothetical protein
MSEAPNSVAETTAENADAPDAPDAEAPADAKAPSSGKAGRGFMVITGAKVYFIITSFAIQLALPKLLGDPRIFGQ